MDLRAELVVAARFRLIRRLGEGGMGSVWEATHTITGGRVALKFLKGDGSPEMRRRFLREARAATLVQHPNVVTVRDVLEHDGMPVLVMELLEGETLGSRIARGRLEVSDAARIALAIVGAVGAAHAIGLVHRDLKPENIFLARPQREARLSGTDQAEVVRVLDFGIAKVFGTSDIASTSMTESGALLGTPVYMAPEQLFGERDLDHRIDVWSLGVMMFEMLTGRRPIDGENFGQIGKKLLANEIPSLAKARPDLPPDIVGLVDRMLRRERADRLGDLREAAEILARFATEPRPSFGAPVTPRSAPDSSRIVVAGGRIADPGAETVADPRSAPDTGVAHVRAEAKSARSGTRSKWPWIAIAAVALASIGLTLRPHPQTAPPAVSAQTPEAPRFAPDSVSVSATTTASANASAPIASVTTSVTASVTASAMPSTTSTKPIAKPTVATSVSPSTTTPATTASTTTAAATTTIAPSVQPSQNPSAATGLVTKPPF